MINTIIFNEKNSEIKVLKIYNKKKRLKFYIDLNLKLGLIGQSLLICLMVINNKFVPPLSHCHEFYNPFIFHVKIKTNKQKKTQKQKQKQKLNKTKQKQNKTKNHPKYPGPPQKVPVPKHLDKNWAPLQILSLNLVKNKRHIFLVWLRFTNVVNWAYILLHN